MDTNWFCSPWTSSNGNISRVTGHLCGEFTGPGEIPTQRPVTRSFDVFFDLCPNKLLSKQSWGWWFETPSGSLWRHSSLYVPRCFVPRKISIIITPSWSQFANSVHTSFYISEGLSFLSVSGWASSLRSVSSHRHRHWWAIVRKDRSRTQIFRISLSRQLFLKIVFWVNAVCGMFWKVFKALCSALFVVGLFQVLGGIRETRSPYSCGVSSLVQGQSSECAGVGAVTQRVMVKIGHDITTTEQINKLIMCKLRVVYCIYRYIIYHQCDDKNNLTSYCLIRYYTESSYRLTSQLMMTSSNENILGVTGHLCGEFIGHRWIPRTKASDAELWCFHWSAPAWTVE